MPVRHVCPRTTGALQNSIIIAPFEQLGSRPSTPSGAASPAENVLREAIKGNAPDIMKVVPTGRRSSIGGASTVKPTASRPRMSDVAFRPPESTPGLDRRATVDGVVATAGAERSAFTAVASPAAAKRTGIDDILRAASAAEDNPFLMSPKLSKTPRRSTPSRPASLTPGTARGAEALVNFADAWVGRDPSAASSYKTPAASSAARPASPAAAAADAALAAVSAADAMASAVSARKTGRRRAAIALDVEAAKLRHQVTSLTTQVAKSEISCEALRSKLSVMDERCTQMEAALRRSTIAMKVGEVDAAALGALPKLRRALVARACRAALALYVQKVRNIEADAEEMRLKAQLLAKEGGLRSLRCSALKLAMQCVAALKDGGAWNSEKQRLGDALRMSRKGEEEVRSALEEASRQLGTVKKQHQEAEGKRLEAEAAAAQHESAAVDLRARLDAAEDAEAQERKERKAKKERKKKRKTVAPENPSGKGSDAEGAKDEEAAPAEPAEPAEPAQDSRARRRARRSRAVKAAKVEEEAPKKAKAKRRKDAAGAEEAPLNDKVTRRSKRAKKADGAKAKEKAAARIVAKDAALPPMILDDVAPAEEPAAPQEPAAAPQEPTAAEDAFADAIAAIDEQQSAAVQQGSAPEAPQAVDEAMAAEEEALERARQAQKKRRAPEDGPLKESSNRQPAERRKRGKAKALGKGSASAASLFAAFADGAGGFMAPKVVKGGK